MRIVPWELGSTKEHLFAQQLLLIRCNCKIEKETIQTGMDAKHRQLSWLCCWLAGRHRTRCTADKDCALYLKRGDLPHTTSVTSTFTGTTFRSLPLIKQSQLLTLRRSLKFLLRRGNSGYTLLTMWTIHSSVWRWLWHLQRHLWYIMPL